MLMTELVYDEQRWQTAKLKGPRSPEALTRECSVQSSQVVAALGVR